MFIGDTFNKPNNNNMTSLKNNNNSKLDEMRSTILGMKNIFVAKTSK